MYTFLVSWTVTRFMAAMIRRYKIDIVNMIGSAFCSLLYLLEVAFRFLNDTVDFGQLDFGLRLYFHLPLPRHK